MTMHRSKIKQMLNRVAVSKNDTYADLDSLAATFRWVYDFNDGTDFDLVSTDGALYGHLDLQYDILFLFGREIRYVCRDKPESKQVMEYFMKRYDLEFVQVYGL